MCIKPPQKSIVDYDSSSPNVRVFYCESVMLLPFWHLIHTCAFLISHVCLLFSYACQCLLVFVFLCRIFFLVKNFLFLNTIRKMQKAIPKCLFLWPTPGRWKIRKKRGNIPNIYEHWGLFKTSFKTLYANCLMCFYAMRKMEIFSLNENVKVLSMVRHKAGSKRKKAF